MDDLIAALTIFRKYMDKDEYAPTHCEHDILLVVGVEEDAVSTEDLAELNRLGFTWQNQYDCFGSLRFGSA